MTRFTAPLIAALLFPLLAHASSSGPYSYVFVSDEGGFVAAINNSGELAWQQANTAMFLCVPQGGLPQGRCTVQNLSQNAANTTNGVTTSYYFGASGPIGLNSSGTTLFQGGRKTVDSVHNKTVSVGGLFTGQAPSTINAGVTDGATITPMNSSEGTLTFGGSPTHLDINDAGAVATLSVIGVTAPNNGGTTYPVGIIYSSDGIHYQEIDRDSNKTYGDPSINAGGVIVIPFNDLSDGSKSKLLVGTVSGSGSGATFSGSVVAPEGQTNFCGNGVVINDKNEIGFVSTVDVPYNGSTVEQQYVYVLKPSGTSRGVPTYNDPPVELTRTHLAHDPSLDSLSPSDPTYAAKFAQDQLNVSSIFSGIGVQERVNVNGSQAKVYALGKNWHPAVRTMGERTTPTACGNNGAFAFNNNDEMGIGVGVTFGGGALYIIGPNQAFTQFSAGTVVAGVDMNGAAETLSNVGFASFGRGSLNDNTQAGIIYYDNNLAKEVVTIANPPLIKALAANPLISEQNSPATFNLSLSALDAGGSVAWSIFDANGSLVCNDCVTNGGTGAQLTGTWTPSCGGEYSVVATYTAPNGAVGTARNNFFVLSVGSAKLDGPLWPSRLAMAPQAERWASVPTDGSKGTQ